MNTVAHCSVSLALNALVELLPHELRIAPCVRVGGRAFDRSCGAHRIGLGEADDEQLIGHARSVVVHVCDVDVQVDEARIDRVKRTDLCITV